MKDLTAAAREWLRQRRGEPQSQREADLINSLTPIISDFATKMLHEREREIEQLRDGLRTAIKLLEDHIEPTEDDLGSLRALVGAEVNEVGPDREGGLI